MTRRDEPIRPMTLGNMRRNGVRGLDVTCLHCGYRTEVNMDAFADTLSVAPLTYSVSRADVDLVVFSFAKPEDADAFCQRFGGERLPGAQQ